MMHYNSVRIHQSLKMHTRQRAGVNSHVWELKGVVSMSIKYTLTNGLRQNGVKLND